VPTRTQTDTYAATGSATSVTKSITVASGVKLLLVITHFKPTTSGDDITGVTRDGNAMSEVPGTDSGASSLARTQMWSATDPPAGTYDIVATPNASGRTSLTIHQFTDVDTADPFRTGTSLAPGTPSSTASLDVASAVGDLVMDGLTTPNGDTITVTVGAGQTQHSNFIGAPGSGANSTRNASSSEPGAAGNVTMSWTLSGSEYWRVSAVSIKPATGGGSPPATSTGAFRRLELWSNLQCAGGTRLAIATTLIALTDTRSITGEESLTATLAWESVWMGALGDWKVMRVVYSDDSFDEWRISDIAEGRDTLGPLVVIKGNWPTVDLAGFGLVTRTETDGTVRQDFEVLGLTPSQHLTSFILPAISAGGGSYIAAGTITPAFPVNLVYAWDTPLSALRRLADQTGMEFQLRRNGTSQYLLDLVEQIGSGATTVLFRATRNMPGLKRTRSTGELTTVVYPQGTAEDGVAATIARARWKVTAVDATTVTLADPVGGDGPILVDDQFNGLYLRRTNGDLKAITDTVASTQKLSIATASTFFSVNDLVEFRADSAGADLVALTAPAAVTAYGRRVAVLERPDIPGTVNLCPNPAQRVWSGGSSVPADSWAKVGSCTVTKTSTATRWRVGNQSTRVQTAGDGIGLEVGNATISPTTASPYFSGYVSLQIASGQVRLEMVASDGSETWVIPSGLEGKAWSNVVGPWVDLGISGIDLKALGTSGATTVRLRVVQDGATAADFYVDSAQITQSAGQLPFIEGAGGTQLWQEGNLELERASAPAVRYDVDIVDLQRLDSTTWAADALTVGGAVSVYDAELGVTGATRVLEVTRNLLDNADTSAVLSNRPEDLTDALVRPVRARRLVRNAYVGADPVVSLFTNRVNGQPYSIEATLQAVPEGCTIYKWVGLSSDTVPAAGLVSSGNFAAYGGPFVVSLDASADYNAVVAAYAEIGGRRSPIQVFQMPKSPAPAAPITLSEPVAGTLRVSWLPNAWVRRVDLYVRKHASSWPTLDGTTTGTLDPTYKVRSGMSVTVDGGAQDASGNAVAGGTLYESTGWANGEVARVILVPIDELDNTGDRESDNRTMSGASSPALTAISNGLSSDGSNCAAGLQLTFAWTPNGSVSDGTHDLKVYVECAGAGRSLVFTETSPATVTSKAATTIAPPNGCASTWNEGAGTTYTLNFTYELIATAGPTVVDSGDVYPVRKPKNTCLA